MAESRHLALIQAASTLNLLESLNFIVNYRKSQIRPKKQTMALCQSYEALTQLDQASKEEILWWRDHLQAWKGRALLQKPAELIIETDAS